MKISYEPGPWPDTEPDAQPGIRAELEALGFTLLGGCLIVRPGREEILRIADSYLPEMRPQAREWLDRPGQVFGSPDRSAFVKVVWFFGCPYAEFSTVLHDGRLIQTEIAWGADPWWPAGRQRAYARTTTWQREQVLFGSPATSQRIVTGDVAAVWSAHREHVTEVAGPTWTPPHDRLDDAVALMQAAQQSRMRFGSRTQLAAFWTLAVPVLLLFMVVLLWWDPDLTSTLLLILLAVSTVMLLGRFLWLRTRHWSWLRPRFRAPVPQSDAGQRWRGP